MYNRLHITKSLFEKTINTALSAQSLGTILERYEEKSPGSRDCHHILVGQLFASFLEETKDNINYLSTYYHPEIISEKMSSALNILQILKYRFKCGFVKSSELNIECKDLLKKEAERLCLENDLSLSFFQGTINFYQEFFKNIFDENEEGLFFDEEDSPCLNCPVCVGLKYN